MTIDGLATLARGTAKTTNVVGGCLYEWWTLAGTPHNGHSYPTAWSAYLGATTDRSHGGNDYNPPAGVPVWFGPSPSRSDRNKNAGDISWSAGGGLIRCTDGAGNGRMGTMTIAERARQTQRPYYGWTADFWGQPVSHASVAPASSGVIHTAGDGSTPAARPGDFNPFGIPWSGGLQKVAHLYGYSGAIDQKFGAGSMAGFAQFLRRHYGYSGNNVLGPVMWSAIARWLRAKYGYVGNDIPGPAMRAALSRAEVANYQAL